ncbi:MAG: undecaprenyldiphospho-muramoylpentapeptide beta-N-acetylglucosaminyltransferase [Clostridia bacterium]|nr:undecaprenyldiphospho-muramoylpentapeptide beta-N-acetylglucosaminyltransferase [Clostridia bacterium]
MKKSIVLTGGGTAGHIMPNIALLDKLKENFENIYYIGTNGMEKEICNKNDINFYEISAPKFVRKLSFKTLSIPFKLIKSIHQCKQILKQIKPDVIFSKGGYVSIPVCIAGKKLNIPVISHESDLSIGLANKIILKYSNVLCTSFKETANYNKKCVYTGSPIRQDIFNGNKKNVLEKFNYDKNKPTILFIGGSLGSTAINNIVYENIDKLASIYNVLHISGKHGKPLTHNGYYQVSFSDKIQDFFAACDICISRSGANTIFELASLQKLMLLIPLPKGNSRGDQVENALNFKNNNLANVLMQEDLDINNLLKQIDKTFKQKDYFISNMQKLDLKNANNKILKIILNQM